MEKRLILADYTEIIGKLISVNTDAVILSVGGQPVEVFLADEEVPQKLKKFLGHKIGLLKLDHIFYIRIISGNEEHTAFYHSQDVEGV